MDHTQIHAIARQELANILLVTENTADKVLEPIRAAPRISHLHGAALQLAASTLQLSRMAALCRLSCCVLLLTVLAVLPSFSTAWSTGSGTCYANATAVQSQTGRHPLTPQLGFYLDFPLRYSPGSALQVTITNAQKNPDISYFNGLLLYALDAQGRRQGTWADAPGATTNMVNAVEATLDSATSVFYCDSPRTTLTHADGAQKKLGSRFSWTAPSADVGRLTFVGLVEYSGAYYYTQILTPWPVCPPNDDSCSGFDPGSLPAGSLPTPPAPSSGLPFGLAPIDQTACGNFTPVANAVVPPGFCASEYAAASVVTRPRGIYVTSWGDLLVLETGGSGGSGVSVLRDVNGDGVITSNERFRIFSMGQLNHGLYVHQGFLYVSSPNTVWRVAFNPADALRPLRSQDAVVVVKSIPGGGHSTRTVLISHDNRWLYVSIGSAGNLDDDDSRSRVNRYDLSRAIPTGGWQWNNYDNSDGAVQAFARGLRNEVGLALDLQGDLWGAMNADDNLNRPDLGGYGIHNDNPAERIDHLRERDTDGGWYGYPYCWAADILANHVNGEIFGWGGDGRNWWQEQYTDAWCREHTLPASYALQAHTAPLGLLHYDGRGRYAFPPEYYNQIFVAEHGSWNSDTPRGYKVARIGTDPMGEAIANTSRDFFAYRGPGAISNDWPIRPVDIRVGTEGELYVSSDGNGGSVIVIRHIKPRHTTVTPPVAVSAGYNYSTLGGPTKITADFSFDRAPHPSSGANFRWAAGEGAHPGLALFDGDRMYVNMTAADNGAGVASPNITGGESAVQVWLSFSSLKVGGGGQDLETVVWDIRSASDSFTLSLVPVQSSSSAAVAHVAVRLTDTSYDLHSQTLHANTWYLITLVFELQQAILYVGGEPAAAVSAFSSGRVSVPPQAARPIALIGRAGHPSQSYAAFNGAIDSLRFFSYSLPAAHVALHYALQRDNRANTLLMANFHMQPSEYTEANYTHRGPANHHRRDSSDLFPGWAEFNGTASIDLLNPANGAAITWRENVLAMTGGNFSIEFWLRSNSQYAAEAGSRLLSLPPQLLLSVQPASQAINISLATTQSGSVIDLNIRGSFSPYWTQTVIAGHWSAAGWTLSVYRNGSSVTSSAASGFEGLKPAMAALGGRGFAGDLAIFRLYDVPLSQQQVSALFQAELAQLREPRLNTAQRIGQETSRQPAQAQGSRSILSSRLLTAALVGAVMAAVLTAAVLLLRLRTMRAVSVDTAAPLGSRQELSSGLLAHAG